MKQCTKCKLSKDESCFSKDHKGKGGLCARCKVCYRIANKKYRSTRERYRLSERGDRANRKFYLRYKYGITLEQYDEKLNKQKGVCAICGGLNKKGIRLAVDHDHNTGKIRGLLCDLCNRILGLVEDSKERLLESALYLERHER